MLLRWREQAFGRAHGDAQRRWIARRLRRRLLLRLRLPQLPGPPLAFQCRARLAPGRGEGLAQADLATAAERAHGLVAGHRAAEGRAAVQRRVAQVHDDVRQAVEIEAVRRARHVQAPGRHRTGAFEGEIALVVHAPFKHADVVDAA
jgi:hypothetical protein